jgi:hypothetical protein
MKNEAKAQFPDNAKVYVQALANAGFEQKVTITPPTSGKPAIFTGSGENNASLKLTDAGFLTVTPNQPYFIAVGGKDYIVSITHKGSPSASDAQSSQLVVTTSQKSRHGITSVISEDSSDADYDDGIVLMTWWQH